MNLRQAEHGFIAPMAIIVIAMLALGAVLAIGVLGESRSQVRSLLDQMRLDAAAITATSRVAFLLLTEPLGPNAIRIGGDRALRPNEVPAAMPGRVSSASGRRISNLALDGRPYLLQRGMSRPVEVRLQDAAGLFNLNSEEELATTRFFAALGVKRSNASILAATLADYTDADDIRRANGAEGDAYGRAGLPAPPNRSLAALGEALGTLGWRAQVSRAMETQLQREATAAPRTQAINVNTASPEILRAVLGIDARAADLVLRARAEQPFTSADNITERTGVALQADGYPIGAAPAKELRIQVRFQDRAERADYVHESWLSLTQAGADRPLAWRVAGSRRALGGERRPTDGFPESPNLLASRER